MKKKENKDPDISPIWICPFCKKPYPSEKDALDCYRTDISFLKCSICNRKLEYDVYGITNATGVEFEPGYSSRYDGIKMKIVICDDCIQKSHNHYYKNDNDYLACCNEDGLKSNDTSIFIEFYSYFIDYDSRVNEIETKESGNSYNDLKELNRFYNNKEQRGC
jgi:hypothetical protein